MKDLKGVQVHKGKSRPISPDSVDAKMSEIFSLRQKVAQAELSARAATRAKGPVQLARKSSPTGIRK
jgi:hypothetical protein